MAIYNKQISAICVVMEKRYIVHALTFGVGALQDGAHWSPAEGHMMHIRLATGTFVRKAMPLSRCLVEQRYSGCGLSEIVGLII